MPDFDKNLKPILKNADPELPNIDNPAISGAVAFDNSVKSLGAGGNSGLSVTEQVFGAARKRTEMAPTVSDKELFDNRRYGVYNPQTPDIEDQKAYAQSNWDKAANGLLKGLNLTATTVAGGFGMLYGVIKSPFTGRLADIWDNDVTRGLDDWNNKVDQEFLPNYYTNVEKDAPWYSTDNWFKTNFLFDKLIKNSGFAVGAMFSGNIANAGLLKAGTSIAKALDASADAFKLFSPLLRNTARVFSQGKNIEAAQALESGVSSIADIGVKTSELAKIAKTTNKIAGFSDNARRTIIAAYSSAGEASWEALATQRELRESLIERYREENSGQEPPEEILKQIDAQAQKVGLTSFMGNLALLGATEFSQLPKLLGSSYGAEKRAANSLMGEVGEIVLKDGKYVAKSTPLLNNRIVKGVLRGGKYVFDPKEAAQEIGQYALQVGSQNYYNKAYETGDANAWVDGFLYGLLDDEKGALKSKEGIESGILGGITGGLMQAIATRGDLAKKESNTRRFLDTINSSPSARAAFKDKLNSVNRGIALQQQQQEAILQGDKLEAKDLEADMMFNYLSSRIKYGRYDMVKEDLFDIRSQLHSPNGLDSLKEEGLANINDTVESFTKRLDTLERTAKDTQEIYRSLDLRYSGLRDAAGNPIFPSNVIEKMAYIAHKINDYDNRMMDLSGSLISAAVNTEQVKAAVQSTSKEELAKVIEEQEKSMDALDILPDQREDIKQNFLDYVEMAARRKAFLQEYEEIKQDPSKFNTVEPEGSPATPEATSVKIVTKDGQEREYKTGQEYYTGRAVKYDKDGFEVYNFPKLIIIGENEDGTFKVQSHTGVVKDMSKEDFADLNLIPADSINNNKTARFYVNHANDVYEYNFGKDSKDKKRKGRLNFDPITNKLFFVYKDHKGQIKTKEVNRTHFEAQGEFKRPRMLRLRTLQALTAEKKAAEEAFKNDNSKTPEQILAETRTERLRIVAEISDQTSAALERTKKKVIDKKAELDKINENISELSEKKITTPSSKREGSFLSKVKFSKVLSNTTRSLSKLSKMREATENELANLQAEQDELEFNLQYFQDFAQNVVETPDKGSDLMKELQEQIKWNEALIEEAGSEINVLSSMLDDINKIIKELVDFLQSAIKKFNSTFPDEVKQIFDSILAMKTASYDQLRSVSEYASELGLLEDTTKEISINENRAKEISDEIDGLYKKIDELGNVNKAKQALLDKFKDEAAKFRKAEDEKALLAKNKELQNLFFKYQKDANKTSGQNTENLGEEEFTKAVKTETAKKPANLVFQSTVVSSTSQRPSDIRHEQFLSTIDMLPNEVRTKLRRIYVSKNNEKALGLDGIIETHLDGYQPKNEDEEQILAVYITVNDDGSFSYIDKDANPVGKVGEKTDISNMVWASMPAAKATDNFGSRFPNNTSQETIDAYLKAYRQVRAKILSLTDSILPPEEFGVSNGIINRVSDTRQPILGTFVSEEQLDNKKPVLRVATTPTIVEEGRTVPVRVGSPYVVNGGTVQIVNNRNITEKEANTIYEVLKKFVEKANTEKVFDNEMVKYLQGVLFFNSPYKTTEDGEEILGEIGRNQFFFRKGEFVFGKNQVKIPFTVTSLENNKAEVMAFLRGTYNNVNNHMLKENAPFKEFTLNEKGELTTIEYPSYQHYLLSTEGRKVEDLPIYTNVKPLNKNIPNDTLYEMGSRYTFSNSLVEIEEQPTPVESTTAQEALTTGETPSQQLARQIQKNREQAGTPKKLSDRLLEEIGRQQQKALQEKSTPVQTEQTTVEQPVKKAFEGLPVENAPMEEGEKAVEFSLADALGIKTDLPVDFNPEVEGESQYRLAGAYDYTIADLEKEKQYILDRTPFSVETVENLIKAGNGAYAFGSYVNATIKLSEKMEEGTGYHEMFEGVYDVFLSSSEKKRIYKEFTNRDGSFTDRETGNIVAYKDATVNQAKEQMAEEFRDKVLYNIAPPKAKTSFITNFFNKLLNFIRSIFNGEISSLEDMFARMESSQYKNAPFKNVPTTSEQFRRTVGTLDVKDTDTVIKNVISRIFQTLFNENQIKTLNELDFTTFDSDVVYEKIYTSLENYFEIGLRDAFKKAGFSDEAYVKQVLPVWHSISSDWSTVRAYSRELLKTYRIIESEETDKEGENSDYGSRNSDSYVQKEFSYDAKKNAPASIKLLIATIQESLYVSAETGVMKIGEIGKLKSITALKDQSTKLEQMVDFAKMFNYTLSKLSSANTLKEKEAIIRKLADENPNFVRLYNRLKIGSSENSIDEWALKIKFYNTFAKQRPVALINYIQPNGTTSIGEASVKDGVAILRSNWMGVLQQSPLVRLEGNSFILNHDKFYKPVTDSKQSIVNYLREIGIDFDMAQQSRLDKKQLNELKNAIDGIRNTIRTKVGKYKIVKANSLGDLDINGRLDAIFTVYLNSKNTEPDSTHINISGERVQEFAQTNAVSRIINDVNNSISTQQLFDRLPHLQSDYSSDSVYINNVLFNDKGERTGTNLEIKYVQGTIDLREDEAIETDKLTRADRLRQAINQNLNENYYTLLPADSKTEYMVGMKNLYTNVADSVEQFWKYYQTEQELGTSSKRSFEFLGDGLTKEQFTKEFTDFVKKEVEQQFKELLEYGILIPNAFNNYQFEGLDGKFAEKEKYNHNNMSEQQIKAVLEYRTVNFAANNIEIHKLFFGDPAAYSDPTKRYKSFMSPREQALYNTPEFDAVANETFNQVNGVRLKKGDPGYDLYKDEITTVTEEDTEVINEELAKTYPEYGKIKSTDGQAVSHLSAYKQMRIKNGFRWSQADERQFQYEMALDRLLMEKDGKFSYKGREALKEHDINLTKKNPNSATFPPIKPIVSGFYGENPLLDKYSIYAITYNAVKGTNLASQYERMLNNGIGYKIYVSGRKVGAKGTESVYDSEGNVKTSSYNNAAIVNVPYKWFGIQVETMGDKNMQTVGSQVSKLDTINLLDGGVPVDVNMSYEDWFFLSEEEKKSKSDVYKLILQEKQLREELVEVGYQQLLNKVGINEDGTVDSKKLLDLIKDELTRRDLNENLREALEIDPVTNDFKIPLEALNNYEQIKSIIYSYVNKYIASPKVNGGPKIQVSGAGWEVAGKRIVAKQVKNKKGGTDTVYVSSGLKFYTKEDPYMEVFLPAWFGKKLRNAGFDINNTDLLNKILASEEGRDILTGIGFRIPTQEMSSIEVFRVAGFLPESMGDTIVVPEEIVTKAGSDFDVDKLNAYLKNVYIDAKGDIRLVPFFGIGKEAKAKLGDLAAKMVLLKGPRKGEKGDTIEDLTEEDLEDNLYDEATLLYKQSIENEYFRLMEKLITLPQNFDRLVSPNNSDDLIAMRDLLVGISEEEFGEGAIKSIISPSYMNNLRHSFITGKGGVGIAAVNQTNTAIAQKSIIYIDPERIANLADKNEKEFIGNGQVLLPSNKVTLKGKPYATISMKLDQAGKYVSDKVSQYINGFVDIGKDAFISQIGVTTNNAGTYLLLEKLGVPTKTVVLFMNQPIIREFQKNLAKNSYSYPFNSDIIKMTNNMFSTNKRVDGYGKDIDNQLQTYITKFYRDGAALSAEEAAFQQFVLREYLKYAVISSNLFRLTQGTNFDTAKFTNPYLVERKLIKFNDARVNNIFSSADELLDKTFIGSLGKRIVDATDRLSESFFKFVHPTIQPYIFPIIREVGERKRLSDADFVKIARKVEQSFISYLSQTSSKTNLRIHELLVDAEKSLATEIYRLKSQLKPNSALSKNKIIEMLGTEERVKPDAVRVVKLFNKDNDVFSQNTYIAAMEELRNNPNTAKLYGKLVRVAFLQSGISTSPISFIDVVPVEDYKELILPAIKSLANPALLENFVKTNAFYKNNWKNPDIVPVYKDKIGVDQYGNEYSKRRFNNDSLQNFAKSKGINFLPAFKVSTLSPNFASKYSVFYEGKGENRKAILIRRVDNSDGTPYILSNPKNSSIQFAVYVADNAWGDGYKAQEYYDHNRQSVLNNQTFKLDSEITNEEVIAVLSGKALSSKSNETPTPVTRTPSEYKGVTKVISGGQTGVDRIGLEVGKYLGIPTGGIAPKGYKTEKQNDPSLKEFGLTEDTSTNYEPRTEKNIINSDGTVLFGNMSSPGSKLALGFLAKHGKPYIQNPSAEKLAAFLKDNKIQTLNVAGNRGSMINENQAKSYRMILEMALKAANQPQEKDPFTC